jgi:orotate phosphoribosyltransferase-like protein
MAARTTPEQYDRVIALHDRGVMRTDIAARMGISLSTVRSIIVGKKQRPQVSRDMEPVKQPTGYTCKCGFRVIVKPCVICQATSRRKANALRH